MKDEYLDYVEDIIKAMSDAGNFISGLSYDSFRSDKKTVYAVLRAIEIIGEAPRTFLLLLRANIQRFLGKKLQVCATRLSMHISGSTLKESGELSTTISLI